MRSFMVAALVLPFCSGSSFCAQAVGGPADDPQVQKLIQQLGDEDFGKREEADLALRRMGAAVVPALRAARAQTGQAEVQRRLDAQLQIWPPERKQRFPKESIPEIFRMKKENIEKAVRALYEEWATEAKRSWAFEDDYDRLGFLGRPPTNGRLIEADLAMLLQLKTEQVPAEIARLQEHGREAVQAHDGREKYLSLSPYGLLGRVASLGVRGQYLADRLARVRQLAPEAFDREQPPTPEEWRNLKPELRDALGLLSDDEKVTMSCPSTVTAWSMMAEYLDIRIFLEPPALYHELEKDTNRVELEEVPWKKALEQTVSRFGLSYRVEGRAPNGCVVIFRANDAKKTP